MAWCVMERVDGPCRPENRAGIDAAGLKIPTHYQVKTV